MHHHAPNCTTTQSAANISRRNQLTPSRCRDLDTPSPSWQPRQVESVLQRQLMLPQQVRDYIVVNAAAARRLLGESERAHVLAGGLKDPRGYYDARDLHGSVLKLKAAGAAIAAELGMDYEVKLPKAAAITTFQEFTAPLRAVFGVFALLALTITGLLIYSLIAVAVEERIREFAILRTIGARRRDIFRLVLSESFMLSFLGVVPGVFAGVGLAVLLVKLIGLAMGATAATIAVEISPTTLALTLLGGAALSIGAALVPAIQATRWRIVDALDPLRRGQVSADNTVEGRVNRPLVFAGLVLAALSTVVFFVLPTALLSGNPSLIGTVILCLLVSMLLGFTLATVGVLPFLQRFLLLATGWAFGLGADLAGRNLERHRRRHTTTALLFTLSVSLVVFIASLVALASRTALALVEHTHGADIRIEAWGAGAESSKSELAGVEGVTSVAEVKFLNHRPESGMAYDVMIKDLVGMKELWVVPFGIDTNLAPTMYRQGIRCEAGKSDSFAALNNLKLSPEGRGISTNEPPPVILSLSIARFLNVTAGDQVQLSFRMGSEKRDARFRVAAVCSAVPGFMNFRGRVALAVDSGLLMGMDNFKEMTRAASSEVFHSLYFVKAQGNGSAQKDVARRIREQFDVRYRFGVSSTAEQKDEARILYWATQVLFGLLLAVAVVIAVFALIASMASTVLERRREIGVLKALGMRRGQLFQMFLGEAVVLTLSSGIAGGAIGFLLAWMFVLEAAMLMELATTFTLPYLTFLATLWVSILAGGLAAHLPTRTLLRKSVAEILRLA